MVLRFLADLKFSFMEFYDKRCEMQNMEIEKNVLDFQHKLAETQNKNSEVLKILNEIKSSSLKSKLSNSELSYLEKLVDVYSKYAVVLLDMVNMSVTSWGRESNSYISVLDEISHATTSALKELIFLQEGLNK